MTKMTNNGLSHGMEIALEGQFSKAKGCGVRDVLESIFNFQGGLRYIREECSGLGAGILRVNHRISYYCRLCWWWRREKDLQYKQVAGALNTSWNWCRPGT